MNCKPSGLALHLDTLPCGVFERAGVFEVPLSEARTLEQTVQPDGVRAPCYRVIGRHLDQRPPLSWGAEQPLLRPQSSTSKV